MKSSHQLSGHTGTTAVETSLSAAELLEAYRRSATLVAEGFRCPDALTVMVTVPFGTVPGSVALHLRIVELLVHG